MSIVESDFGDIKPIGKLLYSDWILAFELISILLLIALVGSIVLAKRKKINKEDS
jgi:NADH-quinone oxidoreductase subunit J